MASRLLVVLALAALASQVAAKTRAEWLKLSNESFVECKTKFGVSDDEWKSYMETPTSLSKLLGSEKKCIIKCYDSKLFGGEITSFEDWDKKSIVYYEEFFVDKPELKKKVLKIHEKCFMNRAANPDLCEESIKIYMCYKDEMDKMQLKIDFI